MTSRWSLLLVTGAVSTRETLERGRLVALDPLRCSWRDIFNALDAMYERYREPVGA